MPAHGESDLPTRRRLKKSRRAVVALTRQRRFIPAYLTKHAPTTWRMTAISNRTRSDMTAITAQFSDMQVVAVAAQPAAIVRTHVLPSEMQAAQRRARSL